MSQPGDATLSRRLHEELDLPDIGPAPVAAVLRRSRTSVRRRLAGAGCAIVVVLAATGIAVRLATAPASFLGIGRPDVRPGGGMFASGSVGGRPWRLAVANLADPGRGCLPAVMLNSANGDLLQAGFLPGLALGNLAFLQPEPGQQAPGWAFIRLRPGVRDVAAVLGDGTMIGLRPVLVSACGHRYYLAGFAYPPAGVRRITARTARGQRIGYQPLAAIFNPKSPLQDGQWFNVGGSVLGRTKLGLLQKGHTGFVTWRVSASLGPEGECFTATVHAVQQGLANICRTIGKPPRGANLIAMPYARPRETLVWYCGSVSSRTAYAIGRLSTGARIRITPVIVDDRTYLVLGTVATIPLTAMTLYDAAGQPLPPVRVPVIPPG